MSVFLGLFPTNPAGTVPNGPQLTRELSAGGITASVAWDAEALQVSLTGASPLSPADYAIAAAAVLAHAGVAVVTSYNPTLMPTAVTATVAVLAACTYDNGTSGVGAKLTANANGALTVDTRSVITNDVILVKTQADAKQNGLYVVTAPGTAGTPFVLTRHAAMNSANQFESALIFISRLSTTNPGALYKSEPNAFPYTVGTSECHYTAVLGSGGGGGTSPVIASSNDIAAQTGTNTIITYAAPADGTYLVGSYILNTAGFGGTTITIAWTDIHGNAQSVSPPSTVGAGPSSHGAISIRAKSGTNIVVSVAGGGGVTYDAGGDANYMGR